MSALVLGPVLGAVALARPRLREGLGERLGHAPLLSGGHVWVHGSSVGEARSAICLAEGLLAESQPVLVSASTPTGREVLRRGLPQAPSVLAPLDHAWCTEWALRRARPSGLVLVETEIWPSWIARASALQIPVAIASGRLSDRSFPRYMRLRRLLGPTLRRLDGVGARSEADAERFVALGVPEKRVTVTGDLKLDPPASPVALAIDLVRGLGRVPLVVAGSTHPGEEEAIELAIRRCRERGLEMAAVIAPRHLDRVPALVRSLRERGLVVQRRSALGTAPLLPFEVLVLDGFGELAAVYAMARVAFVGGTLVPVGGHNLAEPVFAGCPALYGPYVQNVRGAADLLERSGAGRRIRSVEELAETLIDVFQRPDHWRDLGEAGREELETHRGSVARTVAWIRRVQRERRERAQEALPA